jgi:hypothetical protein
MYCVQLDRKMAVLFLFLLALISPWISLAVYYATKKDSKSTVAQQLADEAAKSAPAWIDKIEETTPKIVVFKEIAGAADVRSYSTTITSFRDMSLKIASSPGSTMKWVEGSISSTTNVLELTVPITTNTVMTFTVSGAGGKVSNDITFSITVANFMISKLPTDGFRSSFGYDSANSVSTWSPYTPTIGMFQISGSGRGVITNMGGKNVLRLPAPNPSNTPGVSYMYPWRNAISFTIGIVAQIKSNPTGRINLMSNATFVLGSLGNSPAVGINVPIQFTVSNNHPQGAIAVSTPSMDITKWYVYHLVFDALTSTISLYLNGQLVGSATNPRNTNTSQSSHVHINSYNGGGVNATEINYAAVDFYFNSVLKDKEILTEASRYQTEWAELFATN